MGSVYGKQDFSASPASKRKSAPLVQGRRTHPMEETWGFLLLPRC
jgi:hypothetical protein